MAEESAYGIAWYKRHQWEELLSTADDREELEDTYEEWLEEAREVEQRMRSRGFRVERVAFDLQEFLHWCGEQGMSNTGSARSLYAAELLRRKEG